MTIQQLSLKDTICYTCHHGQKVDNTVCITLLINVHNITFFADSDKNAKVMQKFIPFFRDLMKTLFQESNDAEKLH